MGGALGGNCDVKRAKEKGDSRPGLTLYKFGCVNGLSLVSVTLQFCLVHGEFVRGKAWRLHPGALSPPYVVHFWSV